MYEFTFKYNKKKQFCLVFSRYKLTKNLENINFKIERKPLNLKIIKEPTYQTVKSSFSGTSPTLYCTKTLKKSGGCNTKIFVEDFSLALRISKYGNFSFLNNITSFGPSDDKNRIMIGKKTQLIHDYNSALYYFIKENNDLNLKIKILACKKAIGRAEKWGRRIINKSFLNEMNLLKFKFFFNKNNFSNILLQTCKFFYKNSKNDSIRYMIK